MCSSYSNCHIHVRFCQGRNSWGCVRVSDTPNFVILQFCRAILVILTTRSSGKELVIQQKNLHNFLKSNNCRKIFDKFTKILLKNCTYFVKLVNCTAPSQSHLSNCFMHQYYYCICTYNKGTSLLCGGRTNGNPVRIDL